MISTCIMLQISAENVVKSYYDALVIKYYEKHILL
jgi:hypothetical protein